MPISFTCIHLLVKTYKIIFKTNGHTITKLRYLVVHIIRRILVIRRNRTTLSENWDHPVFVPKSGQNCSTKLSLSDCIVRQSRSLAKSSTPQTEEHWGTLHKLRHITVVYTIHYTVHCILFTVHSTIVP